MEANGACRRLLELFGDLPIDAITNDHGREFRDAIARIPKGSPRELQCLPLSGLLDRDLPAYELRTATTISKALTRQVLF
jgi:hypothetical protein